MKDEQFLHYAGNVASPYPGLPIVHHGLASCFCQCLQALAEVGRILHKDIVVLHQELDAFGLPQHKMHARTLAHGRDQAFRYRHVAYFFAFAFDVNHAIR